jgi:hypothetical protein
MSSEPEGDESAGTPSVVAIACVIQFVRGLIFFTVTAILYFGTPSSNGINPLVMVLPTGMIIGVFDIVFSFVLLIRGVGSWTYGAVSSGFFSFVYLTSLPSLFSYLLTDTLMLAFLFSVLILSLAELLILVAPWNRKFFKTRMKGV